MRRRTSGVLAATVAAVTIASSAAIIAPGALASPAAKATHVANVHLVASTLPTRMFAPYFETYDTTDGDMATLSQESGAHFLSLAFLQTEQPGSCTAFWDGNTSTPIAQSTFGSQIAAIQAAGGDVIPSFGGFAADTTGTELADSCSDPNAIAQVFESLITTYNVKRIDLDIEGDSVNNAAGIDRRNKAIAITEAWAAANGHSIQFSYTLPTFPTGLPPAEQAVLQNAVANNAQIATVNLLTFDYFLGPAQNMVADTESAATGLVGFLQTLYPNASQRALWGMVGITEMPGIDDFGTAETFSKIQAYQVLGWALGHQVGFLSFWAVQRDNGNCPGTKGAGVCSGLVQPTWFFSHAFEHFASR